jgi:methylmalonyl-CoA mutase N-terminal domain/subunit
VRREHHVAGRHGALFDGIPLADVTTSMTINSPAPMIFAMYLVVAEKQGADWQAVGHHPERHPQGVHRAEGVHLPAAALDAAHHRHLRVLHPRGAEVEHDLGQRLPHPRGRARPRCRNWRSRCATASSTCSTASTPARRRRLRAAHLVLLQLPQRLLRGDRQVPRRPPLWAEVMRDRFGAKTRSRGSCASTRRPPASRSPRSSPTTTSCARRCRPWRRCSAARTRCTRTRSTRRWRCRPKEAVTIALRTQQVIAHESGVTTPSIPRRLVLRREADARDGARGRGSTSTRSTHGRHGGRHREGLPAEGNRRGVLSVPAGRSSAARRSWG